MNGTLAGVFTNRDNFFDITFGFPNCTSANFILHIWTKIVEIVICTKLQLWQIIDIHYDISCLFNQFILSLE